jgi:hypothetical protein
MGGAGLVLRRGWGAPCQALTLSMMRRRVAAMFASTSVAATSCVRSARVASPSST